MLGIFKSRKSQVAIVMPSFAPYDAMATHVLELRDTLIASGVSAAIYADEIKPGLQGEAQPFNRLRLAYPSSSRYILYQAATGSNLVRHLISRPEKLLIQYHNITPREQFVRWEPGIASSMAWGRRQLELLSHHTDLALAISRYNAEDLIITGYSQIAISPPLIRSLPAIESNRRYGGPGHSLLFVGRIAPNKAQEDLILAVALYNATFVDKVRLYLVGSPVIEKYGTYLRQLCAKLGVADDVLFYSHLTSDDLARMYADAHVLVSSSRHEGFGFPFVEAMRTGLPIVALDSSAIPETVQDAALLTYSSDPEVLASALHMVLWQSHIRSDLIKRGYARAKTWDLERSKLANLAALSIEIPIPGIEPEGLYYTSSQGRITSNTSQTPPKVGLRK